MSSKEYDNFDRTMRELIKVSHDELKAALDAEKAAKTKKRKPKTSASGRVSRDKG